MQIAVGVQTYETRVINTKRGVLLSERIDVRLDEDRPLEVATALVQGAMVSVYPSRLESVPRSA